MTSPLLRLEHISRHFSDRETPALDEASLEVEAGEFVAIVGQSGAGKSTLLNVLGLLDRPDEGNYWVNGVETRDLKESERDHLRARTFGFVFQDSFVLPAETVARNVALPLRMNGVDRETQRDHVAEMLSRFSLLAKSSQDARTLSGGERQRVAFARAIATQPLVLLADEPTGNLDSENTKRVLDSLRDLHRQGITVIVITHSEEVARVADRRIVISDGKVASDDTSSTLARDDAMLRRPDPLPLEPFSISQTGPARRRSWHVSEAVSSLLLAPARSLTLLAAFVVAICGLVTAANMNSTAAEQVSTTLSAAALDEVVVRFPDAAEMSAASDQIRSIAGVKGVGVMIEVAAKEAQIARDFGASRFSTTHEARAVDAEYLAINGVEVWPAHATSLLSAVDGTPAVLLGPDVANELGLDMNRVGEIITVSGQRALVVGYLSSADRDPTLANVVLVSSADFTPPEGSTYSLVVRTQLGLPARVAEAIPPSVNPAHPEKVNVKTVADLRELTKGVNDDLATNAFLTSTVLLVLVCLTSAISMSLTVSARAREIALRRAVGATRGDIRALFLAEGAALGFAGGAAGVALGIAATTAISVWLTWAPTFDPVGALLAIVAGTSAGAVSAIVPAQRAASIEPAIALRSA